jgi:hypothetical protein
MKRMSFKKYLGIITLSLLPFGLSLCQKANSSGSVSQSDKSNLVTVHFHETDSIFANPGQGWMSSRFPSTIKYIRLDWATLEPERGRYNWAPFDNAIAAGKSKGIKISIRIMTCSPHSQGYYSSPKWLFDEGCKSFEYLVGGDDPTSGGIRIPRIEPDYSDSLYLLCHGEFIKALAQRYDESADVDFLDIGSYGYWGEWHTPHSVSVATRKKIVDMYTQSFKKTPLVFMTDDAQVLGYALSNGTGMRRDGVGSRTHEMTWIGSEKYASITAMADAWKQAPVVFEWYGDYDYLMSRGWSYDSAINFMLNNHVTVINDNVGKVPADKMPQLYKLAKLAGARFVINELTHEKSLKAGSALTLSMKWTNTGVGKVYKPYILRFFLLDKENNIIFTSDAKSDPCLWLPGALDVNESFLLPISLKKGYYKIALAIVNKNEKQPSFHLAINVPETNDMYILSNLNVE